MDSEPKEVADTQGTKSVLEKLEKTVQDGDYYHAQQIFKALYSRYLSKRKYKAVQVLLLQGTTLMLKHKQTNAGTELALLLLEHYKNTDVPVNKESLAPLLEIHSYYTNVDPVNRRLFIKTAINWSSSPSNNNQGDPSLHDAFAIKYDEEKDYQWAEKHYLRGSYPVNYARRLVIWIREGYPSELDLSVARAVFQYLCLSNLKDANEFFYEVFHETDPNHPLSIPPSDPPPRGTSPSDPPPSTSYSSIPLGSPLLLFLRFLLKTLERDAYPLFSLLCEKFSSSLNRDKIFSQYLELIAKIYFGVEPPQQGGLGTLFGSFMKSFTSEDPNTK